MWKILDYVVKVPPVGVDSMAKYLEKSVEPKAVTKLLQLSEMGNFFLEKIFKKFRFGKLFHIVENLNISLSELWKFIWETFIF